MNEYRDLADRLLWNSAPVHTGHTINGEPSECWLWLGNVDHHGYGRLTIRINGKHKKVRAHRAAAEALGGQAFGPNETWDHHCRQTGCIHPNHGEVLPNADNAARMQAYWRRYRAEAAGQGQFE